ncbi:glycosyltransferase family 2 protein [Arthrobacter sp. NPDC092385]|uniref:glycosyltransferase family 2 protein n=1 Tax=Arthrobacter sp. NPDC092385 TaxID=3363943 RepID=UPI0038094789
MEASQLNDAQTCELSIIIPVYNGAKTVREAVLSACALIRCQVIVVDDGSTDRTIASVADLAVTIIRQENQGPASARRAGLQHARGEFVAFLDADDKLVVSGVLESLRLLKKDAQLAVAAGRIVGVDGSGSEALLPKAYSSITTSTLLQRGHGPFPPGAALIRRRDCLATSSLELPALSPRYAEDYELFVRLSMIGGILQHEEPSLMYRRFAGRSFRNTEAEFSDKESVRSYYASFTGTVVEQMGARDIRSASHMRRAKASMANGSPLAAVGFAISAFCSSPAYMTKKIVAREISRERRV